MGKLLFSLFLFGLPTTPLFAQQYDVVLEDGRVMDPESGVDAVRNVGIRDDGMGFLLKPKTLALIAMSGGLASKNRSIQ